MLQWDSTKGVQRREPERILETVSQFGSFSATREREVGISSNGGSARHRELYLGLVHIIHHNLGTGNV